ncbi:MAG: hypothetical protein NZL95_01240 [Chitinophagales bacterium]|nr:hypothetical protein [Chitinophagales bacterium]MDW8427161.1 hypothetical protein [Chitinophagales bacterium]
MALLFRLTAAKAQVACALLEPNNSHAEAVFFPPDTELQSTIAYAGDRDFYMLIVPPSKPNIKLTLSQFETNYNMWLINDKGKRVAEASSPKKIDETIIMNLIFPDTYYVAIFHPKNGFDEFDCYHLIYHLSDYQFRSPSEETGELIYFPNPASDRLYIRLPEVSEQMLCATLIAPVGAQRNPLYVFPHSNFWACNVSTINPGFYTLQLLTNRGKTYTLPLVVARP